MKVTTEQYAAAIKTIDDAKAIVSAFHKQEADAFDARLKSGAPFTDDELVYSRSTRCPCGAGLAYPKACGPMHYWDCAAILKDQARGAGVQHTDQKPFTFWDIKGERDGETTRPAGLP